MPHSILHIIRPPAIQPSVAENQAMALSSPAQTNQSRARSILDLIKPPGRPESKSTEAKSALPDSPAQKTSRQTQEDKDAFFESLRRRAGPRKIESQPDYDSTEGMNYTVLGRHDPLLREIELTSAHAVLYKFVPITSTWEKLDCQGVLFVYSRHSGDHVMMILNRHSLKNFMVRLQDVTDIERLNEFTMVRTPYGKTDKWEIAYEDGTEHPDVWGIWIYDEQDRERLEQVVGKYVDWGGTQSSSAQAATPATSGENVLDRLFTRAVSKYASDASGRP